MYSLIAVVNMELVLSNSSVVSGTHPMVYIRTPTVLCALHKCVTYICTCALQSSG